MKKFFAIVCVLVLVLSVTACSNTPRNTNAGLGASSGTGSGISVATDPNGNSGNGAATSSNPNTSSNSKFSYQYTTEKYRYDQNKKNLKVNYTQLSAEALNADKANDLLKKTAMQTLDTLGNSKMDYLDVKSSVTFHNDSFISNTFEETSRVNGSKDSVDAFRTVNFDLKKGTPLLTDDAIVKSDKLNALLMGKAKEAAKTKQKPLITASLIQKGMESCSIYFRKGSVGFSLPVSHELGDHLEIELKLEEAKPFMTKSDVWNNFTANE
jgi:uncharacterized lipoprotein YehR (DUF1307 family)